jgi:AraC-like DNA-binding protein
METITHKTELENKLSSLLTNGHNGHFKLSNALGKFECVVENYKDFALLKSDFQNFDERLIIPLKADVPNIQMMFSLRGESLYSDKYSPYVLAEKRHSVSYFNDFECRNLVAANSRQHEVTFSLSESFYQDLIYNDQPNSGNFLFERIQKKQEFNTLNKHQQIDPAISGILQNILNCPFSDGLKKIFLREHLRALLIIQFYQFHNVVTTKTLSIDNRITSKDREILNEIKNHLDINFLNPTTLQGLSKQFGINEFKLKYGFKVLFNTSTIRYLQQKRLELSLLLLRDTNKTISEIADHLGYTHANNFSIAFRKTFGNSPQNYRS